MDALKFFIDKHIPDDEFLLITSGDPLNLSHLWLLVGVITTV